MDTQNETTDLIKQELEIGPHPYEGIFVKKAEVWRNSCWLQSRVGNSLRGSDYSEIRHICYGFLMAHKNDDSIRVKK